MYALPNKTQHKLIVRGGISQKLETGVWSSFKGHNADEVGFNAELSQPIFHSIQEKNGSKSKSASQLPKSQPLKHLKQHYITPEHNEMIKFVQQTWKGVERDYKKSITNAKKKPSTASTPLLLTGSYYHAPKSTQLSAKDSFQPFDLETFWGNRILKRLTEDC